MRGVWRRYRLVGLVLIGLAAVDLVVVASRDLWRRYHPSDYVERVDACRRHGCELAVIGGSVAEEGIDPSALVGLHWRGAPVRSAYNLGLEGATSAEVWHAVRHGLDAHPPAVLVYGISASDLNDSRREPKGPRVLMDLRDVVEWMRARPSSAEWVVRHFLEGRMSTVWQLYRHREGIRLWSAVQLDRLWPGLFPEAVRDAQVNLAVASALIDRPDGFTSRPWFRNGRLDHRKTAGGVDPRFPFLEHYRLGENLAYLGRLLDWAHQRDISVLLVDMPVSADLERNYGDAFARYRQALRAFAGERRVPLLDAHRLRLELSDADFGDLVHLNAQGSARMSEWLRGQLDGGPAAVRAQHVPRTAARREGDA
jgi:hypothetical protein